MIRTLMTKICGATKAKKTKKGRTKGKECFNLVTQGEHCHHHKKSEPKEHIKQKYDFLK